MTKHRVKKKRKSRQVQKNVSDKLLIDRPENSSHIILVAIPEFAEDDPRLCIQRSVKGGPSLYRFIFSLSIPGNDTYLEELDVEKITNTGKSLLQVSQGSSLEVCLENESEQVNVTFKSDPRGYLTTAHITVDSQDFESAERLAHDFILPILSHWSFIYDMPIDINSYKVVEEHTETRKYSVGIIGQIKNFQTIHPQISRPEHRHLFAAYREAMNTNNEFYQFLSFYKVAEGVKALRSSRYKLAIEQKISIPSEKIPIETTDLHLSSQFDGELFQQYLGKKFTAVLDEFRNVMRNAIAHLNPTQNVLSADKFDDLQSCQKCMPVIKYIARQMLETEIKSSNLQSYQKHEIEN